MVLEIASGLLARIVAEGEGSPDAEVCGLLLRHDGPVPAGASDDMSVVVSEVLSCRNVAVDRGNRFEIDPAALIAAHRAARGGGPAIVGCYHSHPGGSPDPSRRDAIDAAPDGRIWLIVGDGDARAWRAVRDGAIHGRFDPVALHVVR